MTDDPDFYPKKAAKDRKSIAYAIATKNMKKKKKKQFLPLGPATREQLRKIPDTLPGVQVADITFEKGKLAGQSIHYGQSLELDGDIDVAALGAIIEIEVNI